MEINADKFRDFVGKMKDTHNLNKSEIAQRLGTTIQNFSNKINGQKISKNFIREFCEEFDIDWQIFVDNYQIKEGGNSLVAESRAFYGLDKQYEAIVQSQKKIEEILASTLGLVRIQTEQLMNLQNIMVSA